jgi:hypothetical protein
MRKTKGSFLFDWFAFLGGIYLVAFVWWFYSISSQVLSEFMRGIILVVFIILTPLSLMMSVTFFYYGVLGKGYKEGRNG